MDRLDGWTDWTVGQCVTPTRNMKDSLTPLTPLFSAFSEKRLCANGVLGVNGVLRVTYIRNNIVQWDSCFFPDEGSETSETVRLIQKCYVCL